MTPCLVAAFLTCLIFCSSAFAQDDDEIELDLKTPIKNALETYVIPAHEKLLIQARKMDDEMTRYCRGRARPSFETLSEQFSLVSDAWAGVFFFRFGPWAVENRFERFVFWPDRKSRGLRQVRALLKKQDRSALPPERFAKKSVALQGLLALEYLIFDRKMDSQLDANAQSFACDYGMAITNSLSSIAAQVTKDWKGPAGYASFMMKPHENHPAYQSDAEVARELVRSVILGLQVLRDQMLIPVLGKSAEKAKPKKAFLKRSKLSLRFIGKAMLALKDYTRGLQLVYFVDDGLPWIKKSLTEEYDRADFLAGKVKRPFAEALRDEKQRKVIGHLRFTINKVHQVIAKSVVPSMGLKLGFNALDGD